MKNILLAILTITSLSVCGQTFSGGVGSSINPYIIETYDDLVELSNSSFVWQHYFVQTHDIDASDSKFLNVGDHDGDPNTPDEPMGLNTIGNSNIKFTGAYEGKGHTISYLKVNRPTEDYVGLFGYVKTAEVNNIVLVNSEIIGSRYVGGMMGMNLWTDVSGLQVRSTDVRGTDSHVGGLIGINYESDLDNCYSTGVVYGTRHCGGLIGWTWYSSFITNSYSSSIVHAVSESGGFIGQCSSAIIYNCYAKGEVNCDQSDSGGFIGDMSNTTINKSYATGDVNGSARVGGFIGYSFVGNNVQNSFSTGIVTGGQGYAGGFAGRNRASSIKNCYSTGSVYSAIPAAFCAGNDEGASIENCYATGYVKPRLALRTGFCQTNTETSTIVNCYFDLDKTGIGVDANAIYADQNNQTVNKLTTDEFKNKFNFLACWNIDGAGNDAQPWVSNPNGKPYLYWQSMSVSNENPVKVGDDKYNIDGNIVNPGGLVIATRSYRYRRMSSTSWAYLAVNSKADLTSLFRQITEFQSGNEYIIQAYVRDDSNNKYYGDAVYVDTRETTLPVSLLEFTAECSGNYVDLKWSTASELNSDFFTVEISRDAKNWEVLDYVSGNGTTSMQSDYFLSANAINGTQYFRLSQTDFDGTHEVLQVASVSCMNIVDLEVSVYPNPATDFVKIANAYGCEISIYNSIGVMVKSTIKANSEFDTCTIDVSDLPTGVYYVSIRNNGNVETKSVVISR